MSTTDKDLSVFLKLLELHDELSLPELLNHMTKQASLEARLGFRLEGAKEKFNVLEDGFKFWIADKIPGLTSRAALETKIEKAKEYGCYKKFKLYKQLIRKQQAHVNRLEVMYRAAQSKGKMLQSIRLIIQGTGPGLLDNQSGTKVRLEKREDVDNAS